MRRFEHPNGKFWAGEKQGNSVAMRFGAIGTYGQAHTRECGTHDAARIKLAEEIAKLTAAGYVDVTDPCVAVEVVEGEKWTRRFETADQFLEIVLDVDSVSVRRAPMSAKSAATASSHRYDSPLALRLAVNVMLRAASADGFRLVRQRGPKTP